MKTKICLAGATGWVGSSLTKAIHQSEEFELVAAVGKKSAGQCLGDVLSIPGLDLKISGSIEQALSANPDVFIDYTQPAVVKDHVKEAIRRRIAVVIGTSGLTEEDLCEIDQMACQHQIGVLACGNFAITAVLLQRFAETAAKYVTHWEIIDYATAEKPDAPSGTTRQLAAKLSEIRTPVVDHPIECTYGQKEARGASVKGTQIHSVRLPSYVFGFEIIFGLPHERLTLRHEADSSADPYVTGTLLAARKVRSYIGLRQGLERIMEF